MADHGHRPRARCRSTPIRLRRGLGRHRQSFPALISAFHNPGSTEGTRSTPSMTTHTFNTPALDHTHDPTVRSWVPGADGHPEFPIQNLPFAVAAFELGGAARGVIRVADFLLDLVALSDSDIALGPAARTAANAARHETLNNLFALPPSARRALRHELHALLSYANPQRNQVESMFHPIDEAVLRLPAAIGDYSDFFAGIHHARRAGALFRPDNPLLPNYSWVPVGYHGRASTIQLSNTPVRRPCGQLPPSGASREPTFAPCRRLDFELELGLWMGASPTPGTPVPIHRAREQLVGLSLLDDWSARDIQAWEYQPLGPFLAKSFATSVAPYVITAEALEPYRVPVQRGSDHPAPLPYLDDRDDAKAGSYAIDFQITIRTAAMRAAGAEPHVLGVSSSRFMFWSAGQLITHHSSGGCELQPGDIIGTGTLSGPGDNQVGSLLERSNGGRDPIRLPNGEQRTFLEDGDEIVLTGTASRPDFATIGLGSCCAVIEPANPATFE
ncbi:fumarylacetoacetase [Nocardia nova]|uniref:fumarylacetoacetase n=1 Tax=Nocardia nova TaxID=37330 RepID=UPI0033D63AEB